MAERQGRDGALVIGASSGIGAAVARELVARGFRVAVVARNAGALGTLVAEINAAHGPECASAYAADVTDTEAAADVMARIARETAPLRLVVYSAGVMSRGAPGTSFADEAEMIATNFTGAVRWLGLAAEVLRGAGGGTLVAISSVAGDRGRPGNAVYMATKSALDTYLESLRYQMGPRGVRILTIKPGYVATPMTAGLRLPRRLVSTPERVARGIVDASQHGSGVRYVPGYWSAISWVVRHLPRAFVARMPG